MENLFVGFDGVNSDNLLDFCERLERVWMGYKDEPEIHKLFFLMHFMIYTTRKLNMSAQAFDLLLVKIKEINRLIALREAMPKEEGSC